MTPWKLWIFYIEFYSVDISKKKKYNKRTNFSNDFITRAICIHCLTNDLEKLRMNGQFFERNGKHSLFALIISIEMFQSNIKHNHSILFKMQANAHSIAITIKHMSCSSCSFIFYVEIMQRLFSFYFIVIIFWDFWWEKKKIVDIFCYDISCSRILLAMIFCWPFRTGVMS